MSLSVNNTESTMFWQGQLRWRPTLTGPLCTVSGFFSDTPQRSVCPHFQGGQNRLIAGWVVKRFRQNGETSSSSVSGFLFIWSFSNPLRPDKSGLVPLGEAGQTLRWMFGLVLQFEYFLRIRGWDMSALINLTSSTLCWITDATPGNIIQPKAHANKKLFKGFHNF